MENKHLSHLLPHSHGTTMKGEELYIKQYAFILILKKSHFGIRIYML